MFLNYFYPDSDFIPNIYLFKNIFIQYLFFFLIFLLMTKWGVDIEVFKHLNLTVIIFLKF